MKLLRNKKGFTLIELLVTMTIIAVLAAVSLVSFQGARKTARDSRRKADLESIRSALEMCYADDDQYPVSIVSNVTCPSGNTYLQTPTDPATGDPYYYSPGSTTYSLCAHLEGDAPGNCGSASCGSGKICNYQVTNP